MKLLVTYSMEECAATIRLLLWLKNIVSPPFKDKQLETINETGDIIHGAWEANKCEFYELEFDSTHVVCLMSLYDGVMDLCEKNEINEHKVLEVRDLIPDIRTKLVRSIQGYMGPEKVQKFNEYREEARRANGYYND